MIRVLFIFLSVLFITSCRLQGVVTINGVTYSRHPKVYNILIDKSFNRSERYAIYHAIHRWESKTDVKINATIGNIENFKKITIIKCEDPKIARMFDKTLETGYGQTGGVWYNDDIYILMERISPMFLDDIVTHELGHMLGLKHNPDKKSIMNKNAGEIITEEDIKKYKSLR